MKNLLVLTMLLLLFGCGDSINPLKTPDKSPLHDKAAVPIKTSFIENKPKLDSLIYTTKTIKKDNGGCADENDHKPCTEVSYSYPVFQKSYAVLNNSIKPAPNVEEAAINFIKEFEEYGTEMDEEFLMGWNLVTNVSIIYNSPKLVSISNTFYDYMGGAHGNYGLELSSLNPQTGTIFKLSDLLKSNYEEKLRIIGEKYFRESVELSSTDNLNEAGYWFENNKFRLNDNFAITDKGLWFSYDPYEIAPYAMGASDLVIPFTALKDLIKEKSVLEWLMINGN